MDEELLELSGDDCIAARTLIWGHWSIMARMSRVRKRISLGMLRRTCGP